MVREVLPRRLGLWSAMGVVVGITIGSGIFRTPAGIARLVPNPLAILGLWLAGGILSLCGALSFAELGAMLPETGGFYAWLREGWGRPVAFTFGWSELVLIRASSLGGMAIVFGEYALRSVDIDPVAHVFAARAAAATLIAFSAAANILGARVGAGIVSLSTAAKFGALTMLVVAAAVFGGAHGASAAHLVATPTDASPLTAGGIGLALVGVLWTYDGFADVSFNGGEVANPGRNLPRAIVIGTFAVVLLYLATNVAYHYVLPLDAVAHSPLVAADVMHTLFGRAGVVAVSVFVTISSFSAVNGAMLAAPRVFFAMAEDRLFFRPFARVHPRYGTPYVAILLSALLGMALVMSRSFESLANTFVLAAWPFYALSVAALFRLRRTRPDLPRPYLVIGYPVVPTIFVIGVSWFVITALISDPISTIATFAIITIGVPIYFFSFARAEFR
ncbi:MAG TPA: amino acid permease [Vicinamibacterales bacterium]|nr:amino acid permease [Vicinamibacterales bacterium]